MSELLEAVESVDHAKIRQLILAGHRDESAFAVENTDNYLGIVQTMMDSGHPAPLSDRSGRYHFIRQLALAPREDNAIILPLLISAIEQGILIGETRQFVHESEFYVELLINAGQAGNVEMLKLLVARRPENYPLKGASSPLFKALISGHIEATEYLLGIQDYQQWCPATTRLVEPIAIAAAHKQMELVKWLKAQGHDINQVNKASGYTPLAYAADARAKGIPTQLLALGADPNLSGEKPGASALILSIWHMLNADVQALIEAGANLEHRNESGMTPLVIAGMVGNAYATKLLLDRGAELESEDSSGNTALFYAARNDRMETYQLLKKFGANPRHENLAGQSPLEVAKGAVGAMMIEQMLEEGTDAASTPLRKPKRL